MGRVLALDLGEKRVGLAVSDPLRLTAQGIETLPRRGAAADHEALADLVREHDVERVVVGLPLRLDGTDGPAAEGARRFAAELAAHLGLPVELWDERLSTVEVERVMIAGGVRRGRRRQEVDRLAATVILQSWLDARAGG